MARGILALLVVLVMPATSLQAAISPEERDALVSLYESTGGDEWLDRDGWLGAPGSECGWSGIVCNEGEDSVLRAALVENHLSGPLPEEIGNLSNLVELDLSGNQITGTIPVSIGSMIDLKILRLRDNDLRLPLPDSLFTLSTLEILDLSGNRLEGTVPGKVGSLGGLRSLDISYNAFRGEVPSELAALNSLEDGASDFRFNALTSADSEVSAFLDRKQREGNWTSTQTVPPVDVTSGQIIEWTPIEYRADPGHYRIVVETQSGDSAGVFSTGSKSASSYELTVADVVGELVATVHTISAPHGRQKNLIVSEPSASTDFSIFGYAPDQPFYTVGVEPDPLIQVGGVPQNDTFFTVVNYGGLGGDALLEQTGDFFTLSETSFFIEKFSTRRIEVDSISQPVGEYEGEVRLSGDGTFQPIPVEISLLSLPSPPDAEGRPERRRLDLVSGRSTVRSSATFRNDGSEQLSGQITSDVPWIVPVTESISIDPGESALIEFEIDPLARPDGFSEEGVSFTGTLRLVYADELERTGKRAAPASQHTTGISTTLATVVSTVPPEVSDAAIPALEPGENGFLVPGLQHGVDAFSDISIANAFGSLEIGDLRAFFASPGGVEDSRLATFGELNRRSAILIGAPGPTVFERTNDDGSLQVRSVDDESILVSARFVQVTESGGLNGTALPVFTTGRLTAPGEEIFLTGLDGAAHADLFIVSGSSGGASVRIDSLDRSGQVVESQGPLELAPWETIELQDFAPSIAATAIVRNEASSGGPVAAYAMLRDEPAGDPWVTVDWSSYWGESRATSLLVPIARHAGPSAAGQGRRRAVRRPGSESELEERTSVDLTLFNTTDDEAASLLSFHDTTGRITERIVRLDPRETATFADVVSLTFDRQGVIDGYIRIEPLRGLIVADARLVSLTDRGVNGSTVPLHPRGAGMRLGERRSIAAIDDSRRDTIEEGIPTTWRSRFRLIETSGRSAVIRATMRVSTGRALAVATVSRDFEIGPNQILRLGEIGQAIMGEERQIGVEDLHDLLVDFYVEDGDGSVLVVAESIENATGDSIVRFD